MTTWYRITSSSPAASYKVLIWHPAYGVLPVYRNPDGSFFEAHRGDITEFEESGLFTWWCEMPERPPGEEEPSRGAWLRARERVKRAVTSIGFQPISVLMLALMLAGATRGQHSGTGPVGSGPVTLPVPRTMKAAGARARAATKQLLQFVTRTDDGAWYYSPSSARREGATGHFVVAFVPSDPESERRNWFSVYQTSDPEKAARYLSYVGSLYGAEVLCVARRYHFTVGVDVSPSGTIDANRVSADWSEWKPTAGTPWEIVRVRICRK